MAAKVVEGRVVSRKVTARAAVHHHHVTEMTCAASIAATKVIRTETAANKKLSRDQRPCLNCGKPGHISRDCKQPRAALLDGGADRQQQSRHFNFDGDSEARFLCGRDPQFQGPTLDERFSYH